MDDKLFQEIMAERRVVVVHFSYYAVIGHRLLFPDDLRHAITSSKHETRYKSLYAKENPVDRPKKIIDNTSTSELLQQLEAFGSLEALYHAIPFAKKILPKIEKTFSEFAEIKEQARILHIPDQFNERFSSLGWVAYESMNFEVMQRAVELYDSEGKDIAESFLADSYDSDCIEWGIKWFNAHPEFRRRMRLASLAKEDYLAERYHACVPLLLSMLDGLVSDVSKRVGFFAESTDLTAWDCIAAHESGLQSLAALLTKGRNKTNEEPVYIPYRHGILHGRELAFDNRLVAAKTWAAVFATRDWAVAVAEGKRQPKPKEQVSWRQLLTQIAENGRQRNLLEAWKPRAPEEFDYLPHSGVPDKLPERTPERAVAEFVENWIKKRYGPLAEGLMNYTDNSLGKRAKRAKEDFGVNVPSVYIITSVEDQAAAVSQVVAKLTFPKSDHSGSITKEVSFRIVFLDQENNSLIRSEPGGAWRIVQHSLSDVLYGFRA